MQFGNGLASFKITFKIDSFRNLPSVSSSLDQDQARHLMSGLMWVQNICKGLKIKMLIFFTQINGILTEIRSEWTCIKLYFFQET